jgi:hypothetical protein
LFGGPSEFPEGLKLESTNEVLGRAIIELDVRSEGERTPTFRVDKKACVRRWFRVALLLIVQGTNRLDRVRKRWVKSIDNTVDPIHHVGWTLDVCSPVPEFLA